MKDDRSSIKSKQDDTVLITQVYDFAGEEVKYVIIIQHCINLLNKSIMISAHVNVIGFEITKYFHFKSFNV